tara:strand:+ start:4192 stop:4848 length:657 start_codon:yes stop_codon:yes gene_type:complete
MKRLFFAFITILFFGFSSSTYKIAVLKYNGGGDWYANPTSLTNLIDFVNKNIKTNISPKYDVVEASSSDIFNYPYIYMTGHGNVIFSDSDAQNLRDYLIGGGFLHIDDNYGMDKFIRLEMKKVFPELEFIELPFEHSIYKQKYKFENGLPKIHEHDGKPSQGLALIFKGDVVCFYSYESDLGDGWEDQIVHNNSVETRLKSLKMGSNILSYIFSNQKQ